MSRFFVISAIFLLFGGIISVNAQDLIILRNGNVIEARVIEITPTEIKYRRLNHLDGPLIIIARADVLSIRYENGTVETISSFSAAGQGRNQSDQLQISQPDAQPGDTTLLQQLLNRLPAVRIAGNNMKFEFRGEAWTATVNGENFSAGTIEFEASAYGGILTLKQTHIWPGAIGRTAGRIANLIPGGGAAGRALNTAGNIAGAIGAVEMSGTEIVLEYRAGPPPSLNFLSISENDTRAASQSYNPNSQYSFRDTGAKQEKKTPQRPGNFEVIQGGQIRARPINMENFKNALNSSIQSLATGYVITTHQEGTGFIFIRLKRGQAWVDLKICYWEDEYWYEYWDSNGFSANPAVNRIHRSYRGLIIKDLERWIERFYGWDIGDRWDTGAKQEKKTPQRPGNFEVIQGGQIEARPINMENFKNALNSSIQSFAGTGYVITTHREGTGFIFLSFKRGRAWVDIKICYWEDEYWYEYWDSYRFWASPAWNRIHHTYRGLIIRELERGIERFYGWDDTRDGWDTGVKQEKKTPKRPENFEVIQGGQIRARPINMENFKNALNSSIQSFADTGYVITTRQEGTGFIFIGVKRGQAWVGIKICYWEDEYWYEYWDSHGFSADPARNLIHSTYGFIIRELERGIERFYR